MKIPSQAQEKRHNGYKTIRFPIDETPYGDFLHDCTFARTYIDQCLAAHREVFPDQIEGGEVFNGFTEVSAELRVRSLALLWNFCPSSPQTVKKHNGQLSPAERLNSKRYADNWLENLLISGSMNGDRAHQQNPL